MLWPASERASQVGVLSTHPNGLACFWHRRYAWLIIHCAIMNLASSIIGVLPCGNLLQTLNLAVSVLPPRHVDRRKCCQVSSTEPLTPCRMLNCLLSCNRTVYQVYCCAGLGIFCIVERSKQELITHCLV